MKRNHKILWEMRVIASEEKLSNLASIYETVSVNIPCSVVVAMDARVKELETKLAAFEGKQ